MSALRLISKRKHYERVFEPLYSDFTEEYNDALFAGETWHARIIRARFYWDVVKTFAFFGLVKAALHFVGEVRDVFQSSD
ncbi:MAG: hypothetical protein AAGI52_14720 [Bacteroidota bacterium]